MDDHKISDFSEMQDEDDDFGYSLRPETLSEFIGQEQAKEQLRIHIEAAKKRGDALEHVLLVSPPGLGKTTLAKIISNEIQSNFKQAIGPVMERLDLASTLTNLERTDILFIDEIHGMKGHVQESLYPAMEDYTLDLTIGQGPASGRCATSAQALYTRWCNDARRIACRSLPRSIRYPHSPRLLRSRRPATGDSY